MRWELRAWCTSFSVPLFLVLAPSQHIVAQEPSQRWVSESEIEAAQFFAVRVEDARQSAQWYITVFGLEELGGSNAEDGAWEIINLSNERLFVEVVRDDRAQHVNRSRGFYKVGFHVPDVRVIADRVGSTTGERPRVLEFEEFGVRIIQIRDPDGNIIQLFSPL